MSYKEKVKELQAKIEGETKKFEDKEKCFPTMMVMAIAIPIIVWLILYFLQFKFVKKVEAGKEVRDNTKIFYWTVVITLLAWVGLYAYTYYWGTGQVCTRK